MAGSDFDDWVRRVLGQHLLPQPAAAHAPPGDEATAERMLETALAGWTKARSTAIASLTSLEGAIRKMAHPAGDKAVILVRAIASNLTAVPADERKTAELRRYLETDDVIDEAEEPNGFGIAIDLRDPLLDALQHVEWALAAA